MIVGIIFSVWSFLIVSVDYVCNNYVIVLMIVVLLIGLVIVVFLLSGKLML